MIYQKSITVPANTAVANASTATLEVNKGFIYQVNAIIPAGVAGLAGIRILDGLYQAYPSTPNEWFTGDDTHHNFSDSYIKDTPPYEFTIEAYNLDDTYEHTLTVLIGMEIKEMFIARFLPSYNMDQIIQTITAMQERQKATNTQTIKEAMEFIRGFNIG